MELSTFDAVGRRITAASQWSLPWLYYVGGAIALVNAAVFAELVADAVVAWLSLPSEAFWIDAAPGVLFGSLAAGLFAVAVFVDVHWNDRLPTVDTAESFGTVSIVLFSLATVAWFVTVMLLEAAVGFPEDGPIGVTAHVLSLNLFLVAASALLLRYE